MVGPRIGRFCTDISFRNNNPTLVVLGSFLLVGDGAQHDTNCRRVQPGQLRLPRAWVKVVPACPAHM